MTTGQRLKEIKKELNLTVTELGEKLEIPARTIGGYERDEAPPNQKFLNALVQKLHINVNWFLTGVGTKFLNQLEVSDEDCLAIPVRGEVTASLGYGVTVYNETQTATYSISKKLARDLGVNTSKTEMIFAQGDSMLPTIEGGDSLLVDLSKKRFMTEKSTAYELTGSFTQKGSKKSPRARFV